MIVSRHALLQPSSALRVHRRSLLARIVLRLKRKLRRLGRRGLRLSNAEMDARGVARFDIRLANKI